jgi:hypothetical protein
MTRLDAQFAADDTYRIGVADLRGDGRPDYFYVASVLYSDSITPSRLGLHGGPARLHGLGFRPGLQVSVNSIAGTLLSAGANDLQVAVPAAPTDGSASLLVTDPTSGGFSQMTDALIYGAAATDLLILLQGPGTSTPVGAEATNPIRVRAVAADGVTPVAGVTVAWSTTNGAVLSTCSGASTCSVLTDEAGIASTGVTPTATGISAITAALAPASYDPPQSKQTTVVATETALDLGLVAPTKWIAQGATLDVALTVRVLNMGAPQPGITVNFRVAKGAATLSAGTGTTNDSGYTSISTRLTSHNADVQVTACVAPNNNPCQTFTMFATPASRLNLEAVSGSLQVVPAGQLFQPLVLRVTDGPSPSNPVMGADVVLDITLARLPRSNGRGGGTGMPIILGTYQAQLTTTENGLVSTVPTVGTVQGYCDVLIAASAGPAVSQFQLQVLTPMGGAQQDKPVTRRPARANPRTQAQRMIER